MTIAFFLPPYCPSAQARELARDSRLTSGAVTLNFCYQDTELYPNYTGNSASKPASKPGVNIELLDLIAERVGLQVSYSRYSWNRCVALLSTGRIDSVIASHNADRAKIAIYPMLGGEPDVRRRLTTSGYYLYHLDDKTLWDGEDFLDKSITVAAPLGYSIVQDLKAKNIKVVEASTTAGLLKLLRFRRIDAIAAPGSTADTLIKNDVTRYSTIVKDPVPLRESPYFIVFSKKFEDRHSDLVRAVWDQTEEVRLKFRDLIRANY